jgi:hypothetical protein
MGTQEDSTCGLCVTTLQDPTSLKSAIATKICNAENWQLLVSQFDRLLLFEGCNGEVSQVYSVSLYQGIEHLVRLQHPVTKEELVLLVCDDDTVCIIRWAEGNLKRANGQRLSLFLESCHNHGQLRRPERVTVSHAFTINSTTALCALAIYDTIVHLVVINGKSDSSLHLELRALEIDLRATPGRGMSSLKIVHMEYR